MDSRIHWLSAKKISTLPIWGGAAVREPRCEIWEVRCEFEIPQEEWEGRRFSLPPPVLSALIVMVAMAFLSTTTWTDFLTLRLNQV